jgi:acetyl esterase/lipase
MQLIRTARAPRATRRVRLVAFAGLLLAASAVPTGVVRFASTGAEPAAHAASVADEAPVSEVANRSDEPAEATTAEGAEAAHRLEEAAIDAGSCGSVVYTPSASTSYEGDLCLPATRTSEVVVILVHGGGGTGGVRSDLRSWQDAFSNLGYVTLSIDYRLNDPSSDSQVWPEPEQNLKAAVQFVRLLEPTLGTDQVTVQGHSAGARLGSVAYTTPDDPAFAGSALWDGVSDRIDGFIGFYGYYDGYQFEYDSYYGTAGSPGAASAIDNATQASGEAMLITGDDDSLVDPAETRSFADALTRTGHDARVVELSGRNHGFDLRDGSLTDDGWAMVDLIDAWLRSRSAPRET